MRIKKKCLKNVVTLGLCRHLVSEGLRDIDIFKGVFRLDALNREILRKKQFAIVLNINCHYVVLFGDETEYIYVDPLGETPCTTFMNILRETEVAQRRLHIEEIALQPSESKLCGLFVIVLILLYQDVGQHWKDVAKLMLLERKKSGRERLCVEMIRLLNEKRKNNTIRVMCDFLDFSL